MDFEKLKEFEPFFNGWFLSGICEETEDFTVYTAEKISQNGLTETCCIRSYFTECANADTPGLSYPLKMRYLLNNADTMKKLSNCKDILGFKDYRVLRSEEGFTLLVMTEAVTPLCSETDIFNLPKEEAMKICLAVCGACESYRSVGITMRKICPENIYVRKNGEYVLGDFGICGEYIPTEDYIAPENYGRDDKPFTGDTDIYAIGMLFYKLLNHNRAPFMPAYPAPISDFNRVNAITRRMNGEMPGIFENSDGTPEAVFLRACAFNAEERYKNLPGLTQDIRICLRTAKAALKASAEQESTDSTKNPDKSKTFSGEEEKRVISRERELAYKNELMMREAETKKIVNRLIIAITVIAITGTSVFCVLFFREKHRASAELPTESSTSTQAPTQLTTLLTTETPVPPTEFSTETTESPTEPSTTVPPLSEQPSTTAIAEDTTESTTEKTEQYYTLPELFAPVYIKDISVKVFEDSGRVDEILVVLGHTFGENVRCDSNAILYEYNNKNIISEKELEFTCYYDSSEESGTTVCDFVLPEEVKLDRENCSYKIHFPKGSIIGTGFSSGEFVAEF